MGLSGGQNRFFAVDASSPVGTVLSGRALLASVRSLPSVARCPCILPDECPGSDHLHRWLEDLCKHSWGCAKAKWETIELEYLPLHHEEEKVAGLRGYWNHKEGIFEVHLCHPVASP